MGSLLRREVLLGLILLGLLLRLLRLVLLLLGGQVRLLARLGTRRRRGVERRALLRRGLRLRLALLGGRLAVRLLARRTRVPACAVELGEDRDGSGRVLVDERGRVDAREGDWVSTRVPAAV